jgi:nitrite reductase (NADH) large subunit
VNDPVTLRRFSHFINSDKLDPNIVVVEERGQKRPATAAERQRTTEPA